MIDNTITNPYHYYVTNIATSIWQWPIWAREPKIRSNHLNIIIDVRVILIYKNYQNKIVSNHDNHHWPIDESDLTKNDSNFGTFYFGVIFDVLLYIFWSRVCYVWSCETYLMIGWFMRMKFYGVEILFFQRIFT